jgi:single-strand DNA-binding protein
MIIKTFQIIILEDKMNQTTIAGHLGADPEVRFTSSGQKVTTLRVAARARGGKDETIWWRVSVWGEQFDKMIPYFKKGSPIIVVGEMNKPEIFTDRDGRPQISMSMTALNLMFSPFGRPDSSRSETSPASTGEEQTSQGQGKENTSFAEDEVPF